MPEYRSMFNRIRKYIFYILAIFVLAWGLTSYQDVFLGLILGTSLSLFNLWILTKRMYRFSQAFDEGRAVKSLGFLSRIATAVFGIIIAMEYSQYFHLFSVVIGLMAAYFVIMIDYFIEHLHLHSKKKKRGE
jgi:ATP synthase protein I